MILVIPSIELSEGESVSYIQEDERIDNFYSDISRDPMSLAMLWRRENAKCLHISDKESSKHNYLNANAVLYLIHSVDIPIQYSSSFLSIEDCKLFLNNGIYRIVIDELAFSDPYGVKQLIEEYTPSRISFRTQVDNGFVFLPISNLFVKEADYIQKIIELGGDRIIYSSVDWNKNDSTLNLIELLEFAKNMNIKITLENGISNAEHLLALGRLPNNSIDSCIIGKPLYENKFPCQKIWRMAEIEQAQMQQSAHKDNNPF